MRDDQETGGSQEYRTNREQVKKTRHPPPPPHWLTGGQHPRSHRSFLYRLPSISELRLHCTTQNPSLGFTTLSRTRKLLRKTASPFRGARPLRRQRPLAPPNTPGRQAAVLRKLPPRRLRGIACPKRPCKRSFAPRREASSKLAQRTRSKLDLSHQALAWRMRLFATAKGRSTHQGPLSIETPNWPNARACRQQFLAALPQG